ncbi:MAG TPA: non-homologous end-joining DNA ligase [Actinomycetota bacterium]|jgi:bifunctional non-homologous end joining protein LigD
MAPKDVEEIVVSRKRVKVSNRAKVFYPDAGFTKGDMIEYYRAVAPTLVPHLRNRAVTLKRYPDGAEAGFFYEKQCPKHRPEWVRTVTVPRKDGKPIAYCVGWDQATLVWMANLASIELHTSLAKASNVGRPTALVFDLDPGPPADILDCGEVALAIKKVLAKAGLECWAKTSGSKGMQLYVPLNTAVTFEGTKRFALALAQHMAAAEPDRIVTTQAKVERAGKVLIDWSQNDDHKTTVAVYSLRAKQRPTVSTPLEWREVTAACKKGDAGRLSFETDEVLARIDKKGDVFEPVLKVKQKLPATFPR